MKVIYYNKIKSNKWKIKIKQYTHIRTENYAFKIIK